MAIEFDRDTDEFFRRCVDEQTVPGNDALKQIVLERIAAAFELGETYEKAAVNETIQEYFEEYVFLRRELVNFGYLTHDNRAGTYTAEKHELSEADFRSISRLERHARDIGVLE